MLDITVFEVIQAVIRFFIRAFYALGVHIVLMAVAFVCMLAFDLIGMSGRNALEIGFWEYFWLALSFPVPFLGYAVWVAILFNMIPEKGLFFYPAWARQEEK